MIVLRCRRVCKGLIYVYIIYIILYIEDILSAGKGLLIGKESCFRENLSNLTVNYFYKVFFKNIILFFEGVKKRGFGKIS